MPYLLQTTASIRRDGVRHDQARFREASHVGGISERGKEIKRRRHRRKKLTHLARRLKKATVSEKSVITAKLRRLTPGAEVIIDAWQLRESDR